MTKQKNSKTPNYTARRVGAGLAVVGTVLAGATALKSPETEATCSYEVRTGDSLEGIANKLHVDPEDLVSVVDASGTPINQLPGRSLDIGNGSQIPVTPEIYPHDIVTAQNVGAQVCIAAQKPEA